ncbi:MAG: hypothetical protein ACQEP1_04405 [Nanobdellota archaeon]
MTEDIQLGGNIQLSGFSDMEGGDMIIVKKIVGNHVKRISELVNDFQDIKINRKSVHETEGSEKHEIKITLNADKQFNAEVTERNLYIGIDKALKKVINSIQ